MLHLSNSPIWLSTLVLSPYTTIVPAQGPRKDIKKGGNLDTKSIQNISICWNQGDHWSYSHQAISSETWRQSSTESFGFSTKLYHPLIHGFFLQVTK